MASSTAGPSGRTSTPAAAVSSTTARPLAMLGFSTAAWKLAPRDRFIGWSQELREKNLRRVVDNPRFLILPWIHIPNLGSHILAIVRRQLPVDWTARYNTTPVLIETFVETPRHTGAVYRASGWTRVGATQGPRPLRQEKPTRQAEKGHLAAATAQGLEAHPQPIESARLPDRHGATERLHAYTHGVTTTPTCRNGAKC